MCWFISPGELLTLAGAICAQADRLRAVAVQITVAAGTTRWHSPAATVFRDRAHDTALSLCAGAAGLDEAAELIRRHAARVAAALPQPCGA